MEKIELVDGLSGAVLAVVDVRALSECQARGDVSEACAHWAKRAEWRADRATLVRALRECGAWDDLETADDDTLRERALFALLPNECSECGGSFRGDGPVAAPHGPICGECFASACIRGESEAPDDGIAFDDADLPQWWRVNAGRPESV